MYIEVFFGVGVPSFLSFVTMIPLRYDFWDERGNLQQAERTKILVFECRVV